MVKKKKSSRWLNLNTFSQWDMLVFVKYFEIKSYVEMKTTPSIFQSSFAWLKCDWWPKCDKSGKNGRNLYYAF